MNRRNLLKLAIGSAAVVVAAPVAAFNVPVKLYYWRAGDLMFTRRGPWLIAAGRSYSEPPYGNDRQVVCKRSDDMSFVFSVIFPDGFIKADRDGAFGMILSMADRSYRFYTARQGRPKRQLRGYFSAPEVAGE